MLLKYFFSPGAGREIYDTINEGVVYEEPTMKKDIESNESLQPTLDSNPYSKSVL